MPFDVKSLFLLHALLDDKCISFNINRPQETISSFPRDIIALCSSPTGETIIPGAACTKEKALLSQLKKIQNWKRVKEHSFELDRKSFSFLWRFSGKNRVSGDQLRSPVPLEAKNAKKVRSALTKYRSSLQGSLRPGKVFLVPDTEITFNNPERFRQTYARRVLIFDVQSNQVTVIPFSTKIDRINKATDILFDTAYQGESLVRDGTPAVENYPYKLFTKKTALIVNAAQPLTREDFLGAALTPMGAVRNELLRFVKERMKNIPI